MDSIKRFIYRHPLLTGFGFLSFVFLVATTVIFLSQDNLMLQRNLAGLLGRWVKPRYHALSIASEKEVADSKKLATGPGAAILKSFDLDEDEHRAALNKKLARPGWHFGLVTHLGANILHVYRPGTGGEPGQSLWIGSSFDYSIVESLHGLYPEKAGKMDVLILAEYGWDHSWGTRFVSPTEVVLWGATRRQMLSLDGVYWEKFAGFLPQDSPNWEADQVIPRKLGNLPYQLQAIQGGHSGAELLVWFPEQKLLYTSELIFPDHFPIIDPRVAGAGWPEMDRQLSRLNQGELVDAGQAKILVPAHGRPVVRAELKQVVANAREVAAFIRKSGAAIAGASGTEKAETLYESVDWENRFAGRREALGNLPVFIESVLKSP